MNGFMGMVPITTVGRLCEYRYIYKSLLGRVLILGLRSGALVPYRGAHFHSTIAHKTIKYKQALTLSVIAQSAL